MKYWRSINRLWITFISAVVMMAFAADARAQLESTSIAFSSIRDGNFEIYVMDIDGSNQVNISNDPALDFTSAWSSDGSKIVFVSDRDGNFEIYVMDADGSNLINLTNNATSDRTPAWSPDGSKIAFESNRDGNSEIYVMDADGANPINLTNHSANDYIPDWSPDGSKIAFISFRDGNSEIYVMDADGSNQVRITNNSTTDDDPSWAPDGSKIAFESNRDGNSEIYVMDADGSNPIRITNNSAFEDVPSWSPFPPLPPVVILSINNRFGAPGDTVRVPLTMDSPDLIVGGLQVDVVNSDATTVQFLALEDSTQTFGFQASSNTLGDTVRVVVYSPTSDLLPTGRTTLGRLVYVIAPTAPLGSTVPVLLTYAEVGDSTGTALPDSMIDGEIQIGIHGDVNLDGRISILDVIRNVRIIVGKIPTPADGSVGYNIADMNADGTINIADAVQQVNTILGISLKLIAAGPTAPVVVSLNAVQAGNGQLAVPLMVESNGLIAGAQATFTFNPALIEVGTPQLTGSAVGLAFDSHVTDGTLRVVVYGVTPGTGIRAGHGAVLHIPVTVRDGVTGHPSLTLSELILVDPQAQPVPVLLGATTVTVAKEGAALPTSFTLQPNAPNPFNPSTQIAYEAPQSAHITLTVYNLLGQEVVRLVDGVQAAGHYTLIWHGTNARGIGVSSGVYLYRLTSSTGFSRTKRMTLLK